ncbi:ATP-grasp domain-containing protein [Acinetobacter sp.]|uniref:ATP-grasp domain-containing protein n=1 Tax=Acinetobacter sp. TaxID=472 RepID=UPI00388F2192
MHADYFFQQPAVKDSSAWLLEQCKKHSIQLLFCGKHSQFIEQFREEFSRYDIQLVTGATGIHQHENINNKFLFGQICASLNLANICAAKVAHVNELKQAVNEYQQRYDTICAKPVYGVYGTGFVQLSDDLSYFTKFQSPTLCNTQQFIEAYAQLDPPIEYLIMPFLPGQECSVDIACSQGKILASVTRIKFKFYQECYIEHPCHDICKILVEHFQCDGLINIQFKQDAQGVWHILEINPRPAGGFAYTQHTGINLIAELIANKLHLVLKRRVPTAVVQVLPLIQSIKMDCKH